MYPSDFEAAETVASRIDEPLFLGLPPLLALITFLLLLAIATAFYVFGRWHAAQEGGGDGDKAPEEIHRAVLNASASAMSASSDELKTQAKALRTAIEDYLGPVLEVGKGVAGPVKDLDAALKGEIKESPKTEDKAHEHQDHRQAHGQPHPSVVTASIPPVTVNQIFVGAPPPPSAPHTDPHSTAHAPEKAKPDVRSMTGPEQIDHLSKAVRAFHDHWSRGPERIRELRAAQRSLSRRPPASALQSGGNRVWDRS